MKRILLCGSGELGRELTLELQKLNAYVIAMDKYKNAPAMQVANAYYVCNMLDDKELKNAINVVKPDIIIPEVESIATSVLYEAEQIGINVIPNSRAVNITMNRKLIRKLAAETLQLKTSEYEFADNKIEYNFATLRIGLPCIVKPIMSSSGKGQSYVKCQADLDKAWEKAQSEARGGSGNVIIEKVVTFDYELTMLTVRYKNGIRVCEPIAHRQLDGDYIESWQPHPCNNIVKEKAEEIAKKIVHELGGYGIFGVELFVKGDDVYFSEVSPRPHDTGLVTLLSQDMSEFELHARAILNYNIPEIQTTDICASRAIKVKGQTNNLTIQSNHNDVRLFGKTKVDGERRVGVVLAKGENIEYARKHTRDLLNHVIIKNDDIVKII